MKNKKNMKTKQLQEIWKKFPKEIKHMLFSFSDGLEIILKQHFGSFTLENNVEKKITGEETLEEFTNFSITIKTQKVRKNKKSTTKKWKDISFSPMFAWDKKSPCVTVSICMRSGWKIERERIDNREGKHKDSIINVSTFDNPAFIKFINDWLKDFSKNNQNPVYFNLDGSVKTEEN